jgi:hypothetical protein
MSRVILLLFVLLTLITFSQSAECCCCDAFTFIQQSIKEPKTMLEAFTRNTFTTVVLENSFDPFKLSSIVHY